MRRTRAETQRLRHERAASASASARKPKVEAASPVVKEEMTTARVKMEIEPELHEEAAHVKTEMAQVQSEEMTDYERKRLENIQRNLEFMRSMGVSTAKIAARTAIAGAPTKPKGLASKRKPKEPLAPARKSRRIEGKAAELLMLDDENRPIAMQDVKRASVAIKMEGGRPARLEANLDATALNMDGSLGTRWLQDLVAQEDEDEDDEEREQDLQVDASGIKTVKYTLQEDDFVKATPERIYSIAFHPRTDRVLVAAGDKRGSLSLWSPDTQTSESEVVALYRPHTLPTTQLHFLPDDSSKLVSSSFDGTIRLFDLKAAKFSQWFGTKDMDGISSLAIGAQHGVWLASSESGLVYIVDQRQPPLTVTSYQLHEKKTQTVSQHPCLEHCIATASLDRTVCLWDLRNLKHSGSHPLATMPHYRSVNCAYFSPNGKHLVTVGQENYVHVFATESISEYADATNVTPTVRIPHNNQTGRWLTKLHAAWDPKRPDQYVLGCLQQPRRIQIFDATRKNPIQELRSEHFNSVHSINAFHPKRNLIAGGNSSGRLSLWREAAK